MGEKLEVVIKINIKDLVKMSDHDLHLLHQLVLNEEAKRILKKINNTKTR